MFFEYGKQYSYLATTDPQQRGLSAIAELLVVFVIPSFGGCIVTCVSLIIVSVI